MKLHFFFFVMALVLIFPVVHAATLPSGCIVLNADLHYQSSDGGTEGNVSALQAFLYATGYLPVKPTGYFGTLTLAAVKSFQKANGLYAAGFMGPLTRAKILTSTCTPSANLSATATSTTTTLLSPVLSSTQEHVSTSTLIGSSTALNTTSAQNTSGGSSGAVSASASPQTVLPDPKAAYFAIKAEYDAATTFDAFVAVSAKYASAERQPDVAAQEAFLQGFSEDDRNQMFNSVIKSVVPTVAEFGSVVVNQSGTLATLLITSSAASGKNMTGGVVLVFENGAWKLQSERWQGSDGSGIEPLPSQAN